MAALIAELQAQTEVVGRVGRLALAPSPAHSKWVRRETVAVRLIAEFGALQALSRPVGCLGPAQELPVAP